MHQTLIITILNNDNNNNEGNLADNFLSNNKK